MKPITPCLWFDDQAEAAVGFYLSIFKNSRILQITRYGEASSKTTGRPAGSVLTISFELNGQDFLALNGGPMFKPNEAVSLMVPCESQQEIDHYWGKLSESGMPEAQICGWLKDKYGFSWQIVPSEMWEWMKDPARAERIMEKIHQMRKLDLETLKNA